jgi:hypothetical protein
VLPGGLVVFTGRGWTRELEYVRVSRLYREAFGSHDSVGGGAGVLVGVGHGVGGKGRVHGVLGVVGSNVSV